MKGSLGVFFWGSGDTEQSGNLICTPRPLHFRHKQLSLGEGAAPLVKEGGYCPRCGVVPF